MGFKDLKEFFNLAMLGKQGWRFITKPNALITKVFKRRYFTHTNFLKTEVGSSPSWAWWSLLEGKKILEKRVYWLLISGRKIGWINKD
ncbi:hypothetical protein AHAS_Ahas14G0105500 [Arachis hypogaea]